MENRPIREGCEERFTTVFRRLEKVEAKVDANETIGIKLDTTMVSVLEKLNDTNNRMNWLIGVLFVQLLGFFFAIIKSGVLN